MKRITALIALVGCLFGSALAYADCGGCPKPDDSKTEASTTR